MPMHFLKILQILKSFLENIGDGKLVLWKGRREKSRSKKSFPILTMTKKYKCSFMKVTVSQFLN